MTSTLGTLRALWSSERVRSRRLQRPAQVQTSLMIRWTPV